jgi:hypothetical protein
VTSISDDAFYNCINLEEFTVDSSNYNYTSVDGVLLSNDAEWWNKGSTLYAIPEGKKGTVIIPSSVKLFKRDTWLNWQMQSIYILGDSPRFEGVGDGALWGLPFDLKIYVRANAIGWPTTPPFEPLLVNGWQETISTVVESNFNYQIKAGNNPSKYYIDKLPDGLALDDKTGHISGQTTLPIGYSCYTLAFNEAGAELGLITLIVEGKTPQIITKPSAGTDLYELDAFWNARPLGGTANIDGEFRWSNPPYLLSAGKWEFKVIFQSHTENYKSIELSIPVYVRERPVIRIQSPNKYTYLIGNIKYNSKTKEGTLDAINNSSDVKGSGNFSYTVLSSGEIVLAPFMFKVLHSSEEIPVPSIRLKRNGKVFSTVVPVPYWGVKVLVTFTDNNDEDGDAIPDISDLIYDLPLSINGNLSPAILNLGSQYSHQITASGSPTSFGAIGLPPGLKINAKTGLISGKPTKVGVFSVTLQAMKKGSTTATATKVFTVVQIPTFTYAAKINAPRGKAVKVVPKIAGYPAPTFSILTGSLPSGLSLNASTAAITGTPTTAGSYLFTVRGSNSAGNTDRSVTIVVK